LAARRTFEARRELFSTQRREVRKDAKEVGMTENELSHEIIGAAIEVHKHWVVRDCSKMFTKRLSSMSLSYSACGCRGESASLSCTKENNLDKRLVIDMIVEDLVIIENKAVEACHSIFEPQLLTYLRQTNKRLGLVINFGEPQVKDGIHRVVNHL
jgi:GxxExxY protein